ncbi:hypothetical protein [Agrobacterium cavarae]|uniref:hypothetical protein n=1 Tax=Agrobacterium cavarae TaxID=2528239 RepID=UPI003FD4339A
MRFLSFGLLAVASSIAGPVMSYAQTPALQQPGQTLTLPASLMSKKLSDEVLQQTQGNVDAIIGTTAGDTNKLSTVTESIVFSLPSALPQLVGKAVQASSNDTASAMGLGLCMAASNLMTAASDPTTPPAEGASARNFARAIIANVASASQANAGTNALISNSFGISVNANGGTTITCKAINGEVVATAAVNAAAATSTAGVGAPTNTGQDGPIAAGANDLVASGGGQRHVSYVGGTSALEFTAARDRSSTLTTTIAVPGPEAGAGILSMLGFGALLARKNRHVQKAIKLLRPAH